MCTGPDRPMASTREPGPTADLSKPQSKFTQPRVVEQRLHMSEVSPDSPQQFQCRSLSRHRWLILATPDTRESGDRRKRNRHDGPTRGDVAVYRAIQSSIVVECACTTFHYPSTESDRRPIDRHTGTSRCGKGIAPPNEVRLRESCGHCPPRNYR